MGVCASQKKQVKQMRNDQKLSLNNKTGLEGLTNKSLELLPHHVQRGLKRSSTNQFLEMKRKPMLGPYDLQRGFHKKYSVLRIDAGMYQTLFCQNNSTTQLVKAIILDKNTSNKHSYFQQIQKHDLKQVNISQYIESYQEKDKIYLVQEELNGGNLSLILKKHHLSYHQAIIIIEQIINAMHHLHQQHLSHGSLTIDSFTYSDPDNLLVKLSDLGPVFHLSDPNEETRRNIILQYASPENKKSAKSDVWSIGIILYQLITGQILEIPKNYSDILNWDPFQELNIPKEGKEGLQAMLQYDSQERCTLNHIIQKGYFKSEINKQSIISCVIQLGQLRKMTKLQQILIQFMINKFQSEQVQILSKVFKYVDLDHNGSVDRVELSNLLHEIHLEEQFIIEIMDTAFQILQEEKISQDQFIVLACNKKELLTDYNVEQTFRLLSNNSGEITIKSIGKYMQIDNEDELREEIFKEFDTNQFDLLCFSEFLKQVL